MNAQYIHTDFNTFQILRYTTGFHVRKKLSCKTVIYII